MRNNKRPRRRPSTLRGGFFAAEPAKRAQQAGARGNSGRKAVHRRASREREVGKDPLEALTRPANLPTTEFGTAKRTTTIVLADDHNMVRQGLRTVLDIEPDLQVIGEAADGAEAVVQIERLKPEVLVLDLLMPRLSGLDVIRQAMERQPQLQIVVLTMVAFEVYVGRALKYGARGYVLKDSFSTDLVKAIREVSAGRTCIAPANFRQAVENFSLSVTNIVDPDATLTPRELEVLKLVAEGLTNIQIARVLDIGKRTVETHRHNMMTKLGIHSQADLIRYALQRDMLPSMESHNRESLSAVDDEDTDEE